MFGSAADWLGLFPASNRQTLAEQDLPCSTYYRRQRRFREQGELGLVDRRPQPGAVWNRLPCWLSDHAGFAVSESSVYRVLKRHGLIREVKVLLAWELRVDMTAQSISEVVQQAVEWTGMEQVPVQDRTRLVSHQR